MAGAPHAKRVYRPRLTVAGAVGREMEVKVKCVSNASYDDNK